MTRRPSFEPRLPGLVCYLDADGGSYVILSESVALSRAARCALSYSAILFKEDAGRSSVENPSSPMALPGIEPSSASKRSPV
jgi:hypothetical protein